MDFFGKQDQARNKTRWLVFYFVLAVLAIIFSVNAALWAAFFFLDPANAQPFQQWFESKTALWISVGTVGVILLGSLLRIIQLAEGGRAVARMVGARRILPETSDELEKRFINVVEEMAIAAGVVPPRLYVLDGELGINAFVAGTQVDETVMVVTRGALQTFNRRELQAVVGHEYSHIAHGDMRINIRLLGILAGILLIGQCGEFILRNLGRGSSSRDGAKAAAFLLVVGLVLLVVGYLGLFFGRLIKAAISRQREFLADAASVQYTRDNEGIAAALAKIGLAPSGALLNISHAEEMSHMCFGQSVQFSMAGLLATHPPIYERIKALGFTPETLVKQVAAEQKSLDKEVVKSATSKNEQQQAALMTVAAAVSTIGTVEQKHLDFARNTKEQIAPLLIKAAHDRTQVADMLIALLIHATTDMQASALDWAEQSLGAERRINIMHYVNSMKDLQPRHRLVLMNDMHATLDFLSIDIKQELLEVLKKIAYLDKKISIFEFALLSLAFKWLKPKPAPKALVRRFVDVSDDLATVIATLVMASSASEQEQQKRFENALSSFSLPIVEYSTNFDAAKLQAALESLNRLVPLLKKPLMTTLVELATMDSDINIDEGELLRVIAEQLDCPMPPFV